LIIKTGLELIRSINELVVAPGHLAFWWLGQMGIVLKLGTTVIYIDPFLSPSSDRLLPPLLSPLDIDNADYILGTHDHGDHIDRAVWPQLAFRSPQARFVVPGLLVDILSHDLQIPKEKFIASEDGRSIELTDLHILPIAAAHEFLDRHPETGQFPYQGYVVEGNGVRVFHTGDSCKYEGMETKLRDLGHIDALFLPINGRDAQHLQAGIIGNMTYQEAVDLAGTLAVGLAVPCHYDMFESNRADPELFSRYLQVKYPGLPCWVGSPGEPVLIKGNP